MTLFIDDDYGWLSLMLRPECERRNIPLETSDLNTRGFGDVLYVTDAGTYSGEIKGAAEILGNISHCEAQLQKQLASADKCFLAVYGKVEPAEDGGSYALEVTAGPANLFIKLRDSLRHLMFNNGEALMYEQEPYTNVLRSYKKRHFRTNYLGYRTWLARLVSMGVDVYEVPSREALATQLIGMYNVLTTEGDTLRRIIVEKPVTSEQNPVKARLIRRLMGLDAGIGEELASAFVAGGYTSINEIALALQDATESEHIAELLLRSGKRTVGPAAVKRLKEALGLQ